MLSWVPLTPSPLSWVFWLGAPYSTKSISSCGSMEKQLQAWAFLMQTVRQCSPCCLCVTLSPPSPPVDTGHPVSTPTLSQTRQEWDSGGIETNFTKDHIFFKMCYMVEECKRTSCVACPVWLSTTEKAQLSTKFESSILVLLKGKITGILGKSHG